jgi:hypothetical protein
MHLRAACEFSKGALLPAQRDPGFCIGPEPGGRRLQDYQTFVDVLDSSFVVLLALIEINFKLLYLMIQSRRIVL